MTLQRGSAGPEVGSLQQALVEAGYPVAAGEVEGLTFGESTQAAVEAFQHAHVGPDGHRLGEDGIVGPFTAWALQNPNARGDQLGYIAPGWLRGDDQWPADVREVLAGAIAEIGVREDPDGSNRGPRVDVFTAPVAGEPWCIDFVSWAWGRRDGGSPFGHLRSVYDLRDWGRDSGRLLTWASHSVGLVLTDAQGRPTKAQPGDVFLILRGGADPAAGQRHGHGGIVTSCLDGGKISTCEGNASNAVRGLVRPLGTISCIVRPLGG